MTASIRIDKEGRIRDKKTGRFVRVRGLTRVRVDNGKTILFFLDPPPKKLRRWGWRKKWGEFG